MSRIVILDNDQTTGDYKALFAWFEWMLKSNLAPHITLKSLIRPFMDICEYSYILRPGLRAFIKRLVELKDNNDLDYVVVYTNQSEEEPLVLGKDRVPITIPRLLEGIYNSLAGDQLIDLLLVRPHEYDKSSSFIPKQLMRVYSELGIEPYADETLFFDDAPERYISIRGTIGARQPHVRVDAYHACIDAGILLELCHVTLQLARSGATKETLDAAIINLQDLLTTYRPGRCGGGGLGRYLDYLNNYN